MKQKIANNIFSILLNNWDVARSIRLLSGTLLTGYGIYNSDHVFVSFGIVFVIMALLNWSCCATGKCSTTTDNKAAYKKFVKPYDIQSNRNNNNQ